MAQPHSILRRPMQPQMQAEILLPQVEFKSSEQPVPWPLHMRIAFRFVCSYIFLYTFPFPLGYIPHTGYPGEKYTELWRRVAPWVGKHVLHLSYPITVFSNGSGDTTYDYVVSLCFLVLAMGATTA